MAKGDAGAPTYEELVDELEAFYRLSTDLICVAAGDGTFRRLNDAWEKALGWPLDEMVGRPWMEFVHPEDADKTIAAARAMGAADLAAFENRYRHKNGSWVKLSWRATAWAGGLAYAIVRVIP